MNSHRATLCLLLLPATSLLLTDTAACRERPNIVIILADDLGFGDVQTLNPESVIPTPHIDRLAAEGITFTDAHAPSAVCTPTRYSLLTGRYCWRTRLKQGVLGGYSPPLIAMDQPTIGTLLQRHGYHTGVIGKWHLGMALPRLEGASGDVQQWTGDPGIDFEAVITDSPVHHGFDYFFGICGSLDMPPYVYVRNDRFTASPTDHQPARPFPEFVREGPRAEDFVVNEVLDRLTEEAVDFIKRSARRDQPFLLYLPLTAPHKPLQPHPRFHGKSGRGAYGDVVVQVDAAVGQVLAALRDEGVADDTFVVCTSDNGSYMYRYDQSHAVDHVDDPRQQGFFAFRHRANGPFRGTKADIWEAGHHVPLLVRWPRQIAAGSRCEQPVCLTDLYATCQEIVGGSENASIPEDSCSLWAIMHGAGGRRGVPVVHQSGSGMLAIRDEKWKLVLGNGSGGREAPVGKPYQRPYFLFDLSQDVAETTNVIAEFPHVATQLERKFLAIQANEFRRP